MNDGIKLVLFDFDDTLVSTITAAAWLSQPGWRLLIL